jgi:hypothetical protein
MTMVTINGSSVDVDDPCALYQALYAVKLKILAGDHVEETEVRSPVTLNRIRVAAANLAAIDRELMKLSEACTLKTTGRRARYRKIMRY